MNVLIVATTGPALNVFEDSTCGRDSLKRFVLDQLLWPGDPPEPDSEDCPRLLREWTGESDLIVDLNRGRVYESDDEIEDDDGRFLIVQRVPVRTE
jgi:hypothetical protein